MYQKREPFSQPDRIPFRIASVVFYDYIKDADSSNVSVGLIKLRYWYAITKSESPNFFGIILT